MDTFTLWTLLILATAVQISIGAVAAVASIYYVNQERLLNACCWAFVAGVAFTLVLN